MPDAAASRHARAWQILCVVFALHVIDEALTGFLDFWNPLILRIRPAWSPFPPTFRFDVWLVGLMLLIVVLRLLTPWIRRGGTGPRVASWIFAAIMFGNGWAHLLGSLYFERWLPGATTGPLLIAGGAYLARSIR
jgi:hypothetical protein